jgi:hypothetical protein
MRPEDLIVEFQAMIEKIKAGGLEDLNVTFDSKGKMKQFRATIKKLGDVSWERARGDDE